ncbi:MAG: helix-turn-helix transcriptional regulator [Stigonema ocellatum SAG 48.90 = DSM 106950]|nr:helix-turn-helix transcriptional regulator [Stigonema ocellatum SAG 48.90 = DSM 106950]
MKGIKLAWLNIADLVGVTETTVRNLENNRSGVEWFERISKLCITLECTPNDLFKYEKVGESEESA